MTAEPLEAAIQPIGHGIDAARRDLEAVLGASEVLSDPLALALYSRDASMFEGGCACINQLG